MDNFFNKEKTKHDKMEMKIKIKALKTF